MRLKNIVLIIIGIFSLSLGAVGIFLPVLPTTPFVLLSAGCFSISSPKLADSLMKSKYFGSYIENYRYKTGVPRSAKIRAIVFLWTGLFISMLLIKKVMIIGILIIIGTLVTIHLSKLKTREK
ncbi:MAG: hypothetical protein K0S41_1361 [Anaerocolumna sp.]|nr:hypothetical protein [Anaerocolumna sp.]